MAFPEAPPPLLVVSIKPSPLPDHNETFWGAHSNLLILGRLWFPQFGILVVAVWIELNIPYVSAKFRSSLLWLVVLTELSEQKVVFIHFINLCCFFPSSSRVWKGLWLSSMSCLTNLSWIFLGKMDSCNDAQARKKRLHVGKWGPWMWLGSCSQGPAPHEVSPLEQIPRVPFALDSGKGSLVLLLGECLLLCSLLHWDLALQNAFSDKLVFRKRRELWSWFHFTLCHFMNQVSIGMETHSASQWPHLDVYSFTWKKNGFKNKINKNEILKKHMIRDTVYMCLELKGAGTFWDTVVSPIPSPSRPQKGTRSSRPLPRAFPCHPPGFTEAWVSTAGTCSQAADGHFFQDSEWAGHPGMLHGWICGIPRFLPGWAWRPPERGGEGRRQYTAS